MTKNDKVKTKSGFYSNKSRFDTELFGQDLNFSLQRFFIGLPPLTDVNFNPIYTGLFLHPICTGRGGQICPPT